MSIALAIALYAVWSSVFSIGKLALAFSPPIFLTGTRMLLAGIILLGILFFYNKKSFFIEKKQWIAIFLFGFFGMYLTNILEFWGLQYLSAAKTCFIYSLSPLFTALLSYIHFKEKMNRKKWIGLIIAFIGIVPILLSQTGSEELLNPNGFLSLPTLAVIAAVFFSVYGWILLRWVVKGSAVPTTLASGAGMMFGGIFALTHSFFIDSWHPVPILEGHVQDVILAVSLFTFVSNILCTNLQAILLKKYTATFLSFIALLSPVFASINGSIFLSEPISLSLFAGTGVVIIGLGIVYFAELRQGYIQKRTDGLTPD